MVLPRLSERESIAGWGRSQAASARADAKKYEKALAEKRRYDTMAAEQYDDRVKAMLGVLDTYEKVR